MAYLDLSQSPFEIAVAPAQAPSPWPAPAARSIAMARPAPSPSVPRRPLRYLPHIAVGALVSLTFPMVLTAVDDPMVAAMLALILAIPLICLLWGDRTDARRRS